MYHVNLISSEDMPTHYLRKLPVTNDQKSHDQLLSFYLRILQHNPRPHIDRMSGLGMRLMFMWNP